MVLCFANVLAERCLSRGRTPVEILDQQYNWGHVHGGDRPKLLPFLGEVIRIDDRSIDRDTHSALLPLNRGCDLMLATSQLAMN
ncbi:MAG TPA: hypothetical protein VFK65_13845 [Candidatus Binatia bacterium]|nr:hypothetical protein [Candidatus Binatia bacterium]